jgi:hypothetical protein
MEHDSRHCLPTPPAIPPRTGLVRSLATIGLALVTLAACGGDEPTGPGQLGAPPSARLVVWTSDRREIRMVNLDGTATRTLIADISSNGGAFPHFDPTRTRITLHNGYLGFGRAENVVLIDTTGATRRDVGLVHGASTVFNTRLLADGTLLFVGQVGSPIGLFRVAPTDVATRIAVLPGLETGYNNAQEYGGADISPDGTRVAYLAPTQSGTELRVVNLANGAVTTLEPNARSPRWSAQGDRLAYLLPQGDDMFGLAFEGTLAIINADGTGRRALGTALFSRGFTWSPDGKYLLGRASDATPSALRLLRVSDVASALLRFRNASDEFEDYWQPDWR